MKPSAGGESGKRQSSRGGAKDTKKPWGPRRSPPDKTKKTSQPRNFFESTEGDLRRGGL